MPPSPVNSISPGGLPPPKPIKAPPVVAGVPLLQFGMPMSLHQVGLTPQAPFTPQLNIPSSTDVYPNRSSFNNVGLKTCVSVTTTCRVLPNSLPAPNPAVGSTGNKLARCRN